MGIGGLCLGIPNKVVSQTTYDESLRPSPVVYIQAEPSNTEEVSRLYQSWLLTNKAKKLKGKYGGPCVTFARNFTGASMDDVSGIANKVKTNSITPEIGEIVKTNESFAGHLQVIISIDGDILTVIDSNYEWDGVIRIRTINANDDKILGYIKI